MSLTRKTAIANAFKCFTLSQYSKSEEHFLLFFWGMCCFRLGFHGIIVNAQLEGGDRTRRGSTVRIYIMMLRESGKRRQGLNVLHRNPLTLTLPMLVARTKQDFFQFFESLLILSPPIHHPLRSLFGFTQVRLSPDSSQSHEL